MLHILMMCCVTLSLLSVNDALGADLSGPVGDRSAQRARAVMQTACPRFAPVMALDLEDIYHDPHSSIPDAAAEQRNQARLKQLTDFMRFIEQEVDDGEARSGQGRCAFEAFRVWAAAGALTQQPFVRYSREGTITRDQHLVGLLVIALKLKNAGFTLDDTIREWLRTLTDQDLVFFEKSTNRGNLYYWSGAAAVLFALIDHDQRALAYQQKVWQAAITDIRDDGTLEREMARGQRALIYHMYSFSALLMLRAGRESLGYRTNGVAAARLRLLADLIGRTLCNPRAMGKAANAPIEIPGEWAYRVPIGLGYDLLSADWRRCGNLNGNTHDIGFGGDARGTAVALRGAGSSAR
jgi:poly(beta-D-mannuronate) lyase